MYRLFVVTPEKIVFDAQVASVQAPGREGYFEVLTNHAPIISTLQPGKLTVVDEKGKKWIWAISGGLFEMLDNQATLLADTLELPADIDLKPNLPPKS